MQDEDRDGRYTVRLRTADVEELKCRAKSIGATWVGYLRALVTRALDSERKGKVIR